MSSAASWHLRSSRIGEGSPEGHTALPTGEPRTAHRWHPSARPGRPNSGDPSVRFAELCQEFAFVRPASLRRGCMRLGSRLHATIVWRVLASLRTGYLLKETVVARGPSELP